MTGVIIALIVLCIAVIWTNVRITHVRNATLELIEETIKDIYDSIGDNNNFLKEYVNKRIVEINKVEKTDKDYSDSALELRRWCVEQAVKHPVFSNIVDEARNIEMYVINTPDKISQQVMPDEVMKLKADTEFIKNLIKPSRLNRSRASHF